MTRVLARGRPYPLGATLVPGGVNFAVYSKHATEVFLLLFEAPAGHPTDVIRLQERDRFIWHAEVTGVGAGQLYGYKVRGRTAPNRGCASTIASCCSIPTRRR